MEHILLQLQQLLHLRQLYSGRTGGRLGVIQRGRRRMGLLLLLLLLQDGRHELVRHGTHLLQDTAKVETNGQLLGGRGSIWFLLLLLLLLLMLLLLLLLLLLLMLLLLLLHHLLHGMRMRCVMLRHEGSVLLLPCLRRHRPRFLPHLNVSAPAHACTRCHVITTLLCKTHRRSASQEAVRSRLLMTELA